MSDPVRITNPGAESLGYDSDGHEIMAVDIYVNPPRVDVFHGTPPAWSSFGNKTIWGGNEWVDDSPTRSDIDVNATMFDRYLPFSCPLKYFRY